MSEKKEKKIEKIVQILRQLDETSLLLVVNGANLLAARQEMEKKKELQKT
ncbi:MAG: hypothetical protein K2I22_04445 [Lachnospiraceae bacterium]|nr:hypothetical protein [Lachnospiraceae bacterium]